jgi:death on curing protein
MGAATESVPPASSTPRSHAPVHRWSYEEGCELAELAAAYGFGLAKDHGFVDRNNRIVLAALLLFLRLNGWRLQLTEPGAVVLMTDVATGNISEAELAAVLRERLTAL